MTQDRGDRDPAPRVQAAGRRVAPDRGQAVADRGAAVGVARPSELGTASANVR
jgi:hypothetical protein